MCENPGLMRFLIVVAEGVALGMEIAALILCFTG